MTISILIAIALAVMATIGVLFLLFSGRNEQEKLIRPVPKEPEPLKIMKKEEALEEELRKKYKNKERKLPIDCKKCGKINHPIYVGKIAGKHYKGYVWQYNCTCGKEWQMTWPVMP